MKIQIASDLHLESGRNSLHFQKSPLVPVADTLVLAGDIMCWDNNYLEHPFWDQVSQDYKQVFIVPGNHEFYTKKDMAELASYGSIRNNIYWYNNISIMVEDCLFIFSTLWSYIPLSIQERIKNFANDFSCIVCNGKPFSIDEYNKKNEVSVAFIENELQKECKKKIVITHHAPIYNAVGEKIRLSWYCSLYANQLDNLIKQYPIDCWIYGHSHYYNADFVQYDTHFYTNPFGSRHNKENPMFRQDKLIHV